MDYSKFLRCKQVSAESVGIDVSREDLNAALFDFQKDIVRWALKKGRGAIFADCGMGKTLMQLDFADKVPGRVIVVAPLAVASQTVREAEKFGIDGVKYLREDDGKTRIVVTNYEMIHRFDPGKFEGVVLDESSILKSYTGKFRNELVENWGGLRFRLAATATPAPNDFMELGNHSEFLGAMTRVEMLSQFFVHDGGETQKWRIKGHAEEVFWQWVCSWAVMIRKPSDLGYEDGDFQLPDLTFHDHRVVVDGSDCGMLFPMEARTLMERRDARRDSLDARVEKVASLVNESEESWIVWCDLNSESDALVRSIPGAVEVRGSDDADDKVAKLKGFSDSEFRVLVTKPSIAGWGMNWQHCSNIAFTGLSDSYEQFYQAVRRCWRFGQMNEVQCHIVTAETEGAVVKNIQRKECAAQRMAEMMIAQMSEIQKGNIREGAKESKNYTPEKPMLIPDFI